MVNLEKLLEEINYLKKSHELLQEVYNYISPYDKEINGKDVGFLCRDIAEHLTDFDDNE